MLAWLLLAAALAAAAGLLTARQRSAAQLAAAHRDLRMQSARAAAAEAALAAERRLADRLPDALLVLDRDYRVQRANDAARTAFGADTPAMLRHPGLRGAIERALADGTRHDATISLPDPVARDVHATVLAPEPGETGAVVVLSDRTRDRALETMRADFVANASHELRTPLTSLIGFIDTLRGPAADDADARLRFLPIMAEQAQRMTRLIDDLLGLSRIELTEHRRPDGRVDLAVVLRRAVSALAPQTEKRQARLDVTIAADLPTVPGDADQIEQVLHNLLDNALKYGRAAGTVHIGLQPVAEPRPGVLLAVRDDGPGIARAHIPRLTERFYRVDTHRSRAAGGTGLGLAIVKHIVSRHRGHLRIDSNEGAGTMVEIWLPQA